MTYAGSISTSYDIRTLIDAGRELKDEGVQVHILGTGSQKDELETYSRDSDNIHFHGYIPYQRMAEEVVEMKRNTGSGRDV